MLIATVGNIVGGGVLLGLPLYMMIKPKKIDLQLFVNLFFIYSNLK